MGFRSSGIIINRVRDHSPPTIVPRFKLQILYIEYDCIESFVMADGRYEKCRIVKELKEGMKYFRIQLNTFNNPLIILELNHFIGIFI